MALPHRPDYIERMTPLAGPLIALLTLAAMEGVAYATHRWVMHGPLWSLHASHHAPREGRFERNDWFAVFFATPSILCLYIGVHLDGHPAFTWVGIGIMLYGAVYFLFHDVLVHRRIAHGWRPRSAYLRRIIQAHRLHHAVRTREGAVSFGFVYAPPIRDLKAQLNASSTGPRAAANRASAAPGQG